jgi:GAF domain-containing protein
MTRAIRSGRPTQVNDLREEPAYLTGEPLPVVAVEIGGIRTLVIVPMFKDDEPVGSIAVYRKEVRPFTDKQIELVQNFAAQAVIAIENARLLNELRQRTTDLTEALEPQTATSQILHIISSSPGDLEPVFNSILDNATRICEAKFGILTLFNDGAFQIAALRNPPAAFAELRRREPLFQPGPSNPLARLAISKQLLHIFDIAEDEAYRAREPAAVLFVENAGARTVVLVPMLKEGELVGTIGVFRQEKRPFTDKQIELVTNFAAQAVIAIENARLLNAPLEGSQCSTGPAVPFLRTESRKRSSRRRQLSGWPLLERPFPFRLAT